MKTKPLITMLLLIVLLMTVACGLTSGPQTAAQAIFKDWAQRTSTPYRNARYVTVSNDGTFAVIRITVELREGSEADWVEMDEDVECQQVGGNWSCDRYLSFSLSRALEAGTRTAFEAARTRREQAAESIEVEFLDPWIPEHQEYVAVPYRMTNHDSEYHRVVVQIVVTARCTEDMTDYVIEGRSLYGAGYQGDDKIHGVPAETSVEVEDKVYKMGAERYIGQLVNSSQGFCDQFELLGATLDTEDHVGTPGAGIVIMDGY